MASSSGSRPGSALDKLGVDPRLGTSAGLVRPPWGSVPGLETCATNYLNTLRDPVNEPGRKNVGQPLTVDLAKIVELKVAVQRGEPGSEQRLLSSLTPYTSEYGFSFTGKPSPEKRRSLPINPDKRAGLSRPPSGAPARAASRGGSRPPTGPRAVTPLVTKPHKQSALLPAPGASRAGSGAPAAGSQPGSKPGSKPGTRPGTGERPPRAALHTPDLQIVDPDKPDWAQKEPMVLNLEDVASSTLEVLEYEVAKLEASGELPPGTGEAGEAGEAEAEAGGGEGAGAEGPAEPAAAELLTLLADGGAGEPEAEPED